jgi:biopolymer transport protein ExbD
MSFGSFGEQDGARPMAEINTTPMVDVMLVLLVIFIIAAPLFQQAVQIDLPRVDASKLEDKPLVLQVAIDAAGQLFLDSASVGRDDLVSRFNVAVHAGNGVPEMHLRADRATRYERLTDVMAMAQKAGIQKIAFVTDASRPTGPSLAARSR